ncbi:MAG: spermidine/putrescine ABC transporter substrate-binding protein [Chloroflexi bacterium]|nr:MAG: spermidine/putrescine ABC transporter substrate-binding protein [Chloroflexota bacterium]
MRKRVLLLAVLALLLSGLAIGCAGQATPAPQPTATQAPPAAEKPAEGAQPTGFQVDRSRLVPELHIFHWSEYIDPEIYTQFENEFGVKVIEDNFASNEDLLAKLQAGATGYDIIVPSDYMVAIMINEGMLAKLDKNNIPNLKNLDPKFTGLPFDPNGDYSVPYQWGTTGIGYRTDLVDEEITSWASIFDPAKAEKYAGKISMLNDVREAMAAALKYKGHSLNSTDPAELEEAKQVLMQQKPWLAKYDSESYNDDLVTGDVVIAHGWSGDIFVAMEENDNIAYVIPEEGGVVWVDNLAIPVTATGDRKYTAEVFINYLLEPEIGAQITNFVWYGSPNKAAEPFIDEEILSDPAIYPPPEVMDRLEFIRDVGEATTLYDRIWTEIKSQ